MALTYIYLCVCVCVCISDNFKEISVPIKWANHSLRVFVKHYHNTNSFVAISICSIFSLCMKSNLMEKSSNTNVLKAELLLHNQKKAAIGIVLYTNSNKTRFLRIIRGGGISSLNSKPLKLIDQFIYLGGNISSTENDFRIRKALTSTDRFSTLWKSDLFDKIKVNSFKL